MMGAMKPARNSLPSAKSSPTTSHSSRATAFLIATSTDSNIRSIYSKQSTSLISNRDKDAHSGFQPLCIALRTESNQRGPHCGGSIWVRAQPVSSQGFSNRNPGKIEFALTHSKQTTETNSNRNYYRGSRMINHDSFLTSHESRFPRFGPRTGIPVRGVYLPVEFAGRGFCAIPGHDSRTL